MASLPSRPYDALFDPTYTVSGARDHFRQQGQAGGFLIEKVPEHANLFSEFQHYPSSTFRLKGNDRLPGFVDRSFHPHQPTTSQLQQQSQAAQVNGPHQYKYFRRPHLPPGAQMSAPLHLAPPKPPTPQPPVAPEPLIKDVATQSDYRENETQTLPWSPDWVLPTDPARLAKQAALSRRFNCQGPELLQLADLKFGDGLPGGLQEVRRLEKMREKRAFEASLPPIDDAARLPERQAMIEAWEAAEWQEREEEIKGVQEERLALLENALQVREEEIEEAHRAQIAQRTTHLLSSKAPRFAAIQASRIKTIRQLADKRKKVDVLSKGATQKSSIIDKYADYGSAVYAPLQREGRFPDLVKPAAGALAPPLAAPGAKPASTQKAALDADTLVPASLGGLQELQASLPARALQPTMHKPKAPAKLNYTQRQELAVQHDVETISNLLQTAKQSQGRGVGQVWPYPVDQTSGSSVNSSSPTGKTGRGVAGRLSSSMAATRDSKGAAGLAAAKPLAAAADHAAVPEAPPLADPTGQHAALVLLQRLLRGRAVQNEMYAGKAAKLQLVRELRLGLEGTAGSQPQPEVRDAFTQELDAVIGAAVCQVCCLLASDDQAAITQLLMDVAAKQQQEQQQLEEQPAGTQEAPAAVQEAQQQRGLSAGAAAVHEQIEQLPVQQEHNLFSMEASSHAATDSQPEQKQPQQQEDQLPDEAQTGESDLPLQRTGSATAATVEAERAESLQHASTDADVVGHELAVAAAPDAEGLPTDPQQFAESIDTYIGSKGHSAVDVGAEPAAAAEGQNSPDQQDGDNTRQRIRGGDHAYIAETAAYPEPEGSGSEQQQAQQLSHEAEPEAQASSSYTMPPDTSSSQMAMSSAAVGSEVLEASLAGGVGRAAHGSRGLNDSAAASSASLTHSVGADVSLAFGVHGDHSGDSQHAEEASFRQPVVQTSAAEQSGESLSSSSSSSSSSSEGNSGGDAAAVDAEDSS